MKKRLIVKVATLAILFAVLLPCVFSAAEMIVSLPTLAPANEISYVIDGRIIKEIPNDVTVAEFLAAYGDDGAYITKQNDYRAADASRIGTGYKLVTGLKEEYTLVVEGDVNGDTFVSSKDLIRAKKLMLTEEYSIYESAMDFNNDGVINTSDINALTNYVVVHDSPPTLEQMPSVDLGDSFFATIDLSYANNAIEARIGNNVVAMAKDTTSPNQIWHFTRNEDGSYFIQNVAMGGVLDVAYSSADFGTNVAVYKNVNGDNQKWFIIQHEDGYIFSTKCAEDRVLDIANASAEDNANAQIYGLNYTCSQIFNISKVADVESDITSYFTRFAPLSSPKTFYANMTFGTRNISVETNGNVSIKKAAQYWRFEHQADGSYKITSSYNGKALDVAGAAMANSTNIQTYASNDTLAQRWYIYMKDGKAMLRSAANQNFVVDVYSGTDAENVNVHLYEMNSSAAQWFTLSDYTENLPAFSVTCPYNSVIYGRYHTLEEAKKNTVDFLGQVVHNLNGQLVYNPCPSYMAAKILYNAKIVSDFAAAHGFVYGHADHNPGYNWQSLDITRPTVRDERCSSCDRFVDWVLWRCGITAAQGNKTDHGPVVYEQVNWIPKFGYIKITDPAALKPGDIVFTSYDYTKPGTPGHIFICASNNMGGNLYLRYDHGSIARIRYLKGNEYYYGQAPFIETIGTPDQPIFYYAYRPID